MIGKLTGTFGGGTPDGAALVEVGGVGYCVRVPLGTLAEMHAIASSSVSLYIHTAVREDAIDLYGFANQEELAFFKQLMSVSGIGPKTALGILNVSDVATLKRSIARGDAAALTKVFGIGKKSAERIVVELRDKVSLESGVKKGEKIPEGDAEVIEALIALGYSAQESRTILKDIPAGAVSVNERIGAALKQLGTRV